MFIYIISILTKCSLIQCFKYHVPHFSLYFFSRPLLTISYINKHIVIQDNFIKHVFFYILTAFIPCDGEGIRTSDQILILFCYTVYWIHAMWMGCVRPISYESKCPIHLINERSTWVLVITFALNAKVMNHIRRQNKTQVSSTIEF